ncbi:MAG: SDR family NAD(P)-dependent oxidoreductase, partial [Planctomycetota bacterium]
MKPGPPERTALVTGGSRGIGAAIVQALACDGCRVAFNHWQDPGGAAEVVSRLQDLGHGCLAVETDVSDLEAAERMVARVVEELGRLDLLICNAGVPADRAVWNMTEGEWDRVIAVNLKGCF